MPNKRALSISLVLLAAFAFAAFALPTEYSRKEWHPRWEDADGDCQNTRQEVLISESIIEVELDPAGCRVTSGLWVDYYSGRVFTDPRQLDIDHLVPLKEAHESGGSLWSEAKKHAFANDLSDPAALIAVSAGENRSKGAKDPARWMPSNTKFHCEYATAWREIKEKWGLESDRKESKSINRILSNCPGGKK